MNVIVDSSEIISAIIKDGKTREIIINSWPEFLMPLVVFEEIEKYESLLIDKSGLSKEEVWEIIKKLCKYITLIPDEVLRPYIYEGLKLIGESDEEDSLFIASALAYQGSIIWSDDKHFKNQDKIKVYTTKELIGLLADNIV